MATLVSDLVLRVRRGLRDFAHVRTDKGTGDGVTSVYDLGKDIGVVTSSDAVTVAGVAKVRNVDYAIDYDANQITFTAPPAAAAAIALQYKEVIYRDEVAIDALNAGRQVIFPKCYKRGSATITIRNLVRDYDLATADVNEVAMRAVFAQGNANYLIERAVLTKNGTSDQTRYPFRKFYQVGESKIHCWKMLGVADTLQIEALFAFSAFSVLTDPVDVPEQFQELVVLWAIASLALKSEPQRDRFDTAAVMQSSNANPVGTMAQTADDFRKKFWEMYAKMKGSGSFVIEPRDMPLAFEVGISW